MSTTNTADWIITVYNEEDRIVEQALIANYTEATAHKYAINWVERTHVGLDWSLMRLSFWQEFKNRGDAILRLPLLAHA